MTKKQRRIQLQNELYSKLEAKDIMEHSLLAVNNLSSEVFWIQQKIPCRLVDSKKMINSILHQLNERIEILHLLLELIV